eukprot:159544_1
MIAFLIGKKIVFMVGYRIGACKWRRLLFCFRFPLRYPGFDIFCVCVYFATVLFMFMFLVRIFHLCLSSLECFVIAISILILPHNAFASNAFCRTFFVYMFF